MIQHAEFRMGGIRRFRAQKMLAPDAEILVRVISEPATGTRFSWEWVGSPRRAVKLEDALLRRYAGIETREFPERLDCFPLPLVKIREESRYIVPRCAYYVQDLGFPFPLTYRLLYRGRAWLELMGARLLYAASIWNLLDVEFGRVPSWRDLKIVRVLTDG